MLIIRLVARAAAVFAPALLAACTAATSIEPAPAPADGSVAVAGNAAWTDTNIAVRPGQLIDVRATGRITVARWSYFHRDGPRQVGPAGTYEYPADETYRDYPLAAAGRGPLPPFGLIGRIGENGAPFPIGNGGVVRAPAAGRLQLGVNDFDVTDNSGAWRVELGRPEEGSHRVPVGPGGTDARPLLADADPSPAPVGDARVLVLFIDGLGYETLREMAYGGYLPNIRSLFFDGGIDIGPTFTVAPSNTIVATAASLTGSWPDRTGLFTQMVFDRSDGDINYLATPDGPVKAAEHLEAAWWQRAVTDAERPPLLKRRVEQAAQVFRSTVVPVMPDYPPDRYPQRVANELPLLGTHRLKDRYFDAAETAYALSDVVEHEARVMFVYYSGVDVASHRSPRGLWGESRRDLVRIDRDVGRLRAELEREGLDDRTYWLLYADHGSLGGRDFIPQSWDVANELFYASIRDADGDRVPDASGGLGLNVLFLLDDFTVQRDHTDMPARDFVVAAAQAYDIAWVALPKASADSRDWSVPNSYADLVRYRVHGEFEPVDVLQRLLDAREPRSDAAGPDAGEHPVRFVILPLAPDAVLVRTRDSQALIERRRRASLDPRAFEYRYRVIGGIEVAGGEYRILPPRSGRHDPFGYLEEPAARPLVQTGERGGWYDEREWLRATADSLYPDAVVAYAHMLLDDPEHPRIDARARYDLMVVAAPGWNFAPGPHAPAPDHGGPHRDEKRIPFLVAGPGLPRGVRLDRPSRIIDVLPTTLELARIAYDPFSMDGRPVRGIWQDAGRARDVAPQDVPLHWDHGLTMPPISTARVHGPLGHDIRRWYDLHNLAATAATLTSQEVLRLIDRSYDALLPGQEIRPVQATLTEIAHGYGRLPESKLKRRPAELIEALRLHNITVGELIDPVQSLQHVDRVALVIDWVRRVLNDPFGEPWPERFTPMTPVDWTLGGLSRGLLGVRRVLLEWATRAGDAAIRTSETGYRSIAEAIAGRAWQTPRVEPGHDPSPPPAALP
ncbi:MAG TPA: alkaline phosphatase family protein [Candidatus Limnocylindrales bacterium]|nr:alkaline phosphatase family protein [Candidatus Limnocylindrales bacterium]